MLLEGVGLYSFKGWSPAPVSKPGALMPVKSASPVGSRLPLEKAQPGSQLSITVAGSGHPASPSAGHWALGQACSSLLDRAALCWLATDVGTGTKRGIQGW